MKGGVFMNTKTKTAKTTNISENETNKKKATERIMDILIQLFYEKSLEKKEDIVFVIQKIIMSILLLVAIIMIAGLIFGIIIMNQNEFVDEKTFLFFKNVITYKDSILAGIIIYIMFCCFLSDNS